MDNQHSQLIQTKLCVPKLRSRTVGRRRLVEKANAEPGVLLTLVSAPPGYGKTTLMVELSHASSESGAAIAWYTLDSSDNNPSLFVSYLVEGLAEALQIGTVLAPVGNLIDSSTELKIEKILPAIINAIVAAERNCLLFLDDYHSITSPAIHSGLTFLLDHLPENMHVVVGSRSDPPFPLARLRARGILAEIRAADLRFTLEEAALFLNETMSLGLPSEAIADIEKSTEGWVTGLQLAALTMAGRPDGVNYISRFGGGSRYLVEYLIQEVVEREPSEVRRFLLSTAVLERMCASLCDAILGGQSGGDAILHQLEQRNLFVVPLDDEAHWYRYHQLFRDFLRTRLNQSEPDLVPFLHRAASEWYASQHLLPEAVSHAFETRDWDYAAGVVEQHGMTMFGRSGISILSRWCENFPEETFRTHPLLCILQGWPLGLSYRKENRRRVEELMGQAEQAASAMQDRQRGRWLTAQAALVRLSLCLIPDPATDPEQTIGLAQRTLDFLSAVDPRRSVPYSAIGYAYLSLLNISMGRKALEEFRRLSLAGGFYYGAAAATFYLANLAYYQGHLGQAEDMSSQLQSNMRSLMSDPEADLPALGSLEISKGCVLLEENRLGEAEHALQHGLELTSGTNNPFYRMVACVALFRLREIQGREADAFHFLDDIEGAWPDVSFYIQGLRLMHRIRTAPEQKQTLAKAENWCHMFSPHVGENVRLPGIGPFGGTEAYYQSSLIWVQAKSLLGKAVETLNYLERQIRAAETEGLAYRLIELLLSEALARWSLGEDKQSLELLERALNMGESTGCLRVFDRGPALTDLLKEAVRRDIAREYGEKIIKAVGTAAGLFSEERETAVLSARTPAGLEILSEREIEVLSLMAKGASNQELADQLFVAVGTIKSHVNHILSKLDAHSRLEAVARARELGLLKF